MKRPLPRGPVKYRKPHAINVVSIAFFLFVGALGYLAFCYWPTLRLKSNAKSAMQESLVQFYRLNLRNDKRRLKDQETLEKTLLANLTRAGVTDPGLKLDIDMNPKTVALAATFVSQFELVGLNKSYPIHHHLEVKTDAARIDW